MGNVPASYVYADNTAAAGVSVSLGTGGGAGFSGGLGRTGSPTIVDWTLDPFSYAAALSPPLNNTVMNDHITPSMDFISFGWFDEIVGVRIDGLVPDAVTGPMTFQVYVVADDVVGENEPAVNIHVGAINEADAGPTDFAAFSPVVVSRGDAVGDPDPWELGTNYARTSVTLTRNETLVIGSQYQTFGGKWGVINAIQIVPTGGGAETVSVDLEGQTLSVGKLEFQGNRTATGGHNYEIVNGSLTVHGVDENGTLVGLEQTGAASNAIHTTLHGNGIQAAISNGTLELGSDNPGFSPNPFSIAGGRLLLTGDSNAVQTTTTLAGGSLESIGDNHIAGVALTADGEIFVDQGTLTAGPVTGTGDLEKTGSGKLTVTGSGAFTGDVTVDAGMLFVVGSMPAAGDFTVNSGATLGGGGTIGGAVTVNSGGHLAPGDGPVTFTAGTVSLATGSHLQIEIDGPAGAGLPGGHSRLLVSNGETDDVNLDSDTGGGATLSVVLGYAPGPNDSFKIVDNEGADPIQGTFAGLPEGATWNVNGEVLAITYAGGDGNDVVLMMSSEIRGSKWNDRDSDGEWDDGEPSLRGWTIYLDENRNSRLDTGEIRTTTNQDGNYVFTNLTPGDYTVAEQPQTGWEQTHPPAGVHDVNLRPGDSLVGLNFGNRADTLVVDELLPSPSGFEARFSRPVDPADLSLYDVSTGAFGPADVTLVNSSGNPVVGSLVTDTDSITFVATGGPLLADDYAVTLRSAANGFKDQVGELLDGDHNGSPGGDFIGQFSIDVVEPVVVSLPDFTRGASQPVNVPALDLSSSQGTGGLPVRISQAGGVSTAELTLRYDPALLHITDAVPGQDAPEGASVQFSDAGSGRVTVSYSSPSPSPAGSAVIIELMADVPSSATYGAAHVVDMTSVTVNAGAIGVTADDAIHVAAFFGETTGNGYQYPGNNPYSGLDAQRAARVAIGLDTGFAAYPQIDPVIIADATLNGEVSGLDAQRIAKEAVGLDPWEIPPLPQVITSPQRQAVPSSQDRQSLDDRASSDPAASAPSSESTTSVFGWLGSKREVRALSPQNSSILGARCTRLQPPRILQSGIAEVILEPSPNDFALRNGGELRNAGELESAFAPRKSALSRSEGPHTEFAVDEFLSHDSFDEDGIDAYFAVLGQMRWGDPWRFPG